MSRFKLLDRIRGSVLAGSVGTSASEDKLLSSRESHPGLSQLIPGSRLLIEGTRFSPDRHQGKDNLLLLSARGDRSDGSGAVPRSPQGTAEVLSPGGRMSFLTTRNLPLDSVTAAVARKAIC